MSGSGAKKGQAMIEYVLVFTSLIVVVTALTHYLKAVTESSERTSTLVSGDYP